MSSPFDPTEQRVGSEDMHLAHWAQTDGAKALKAGLQGRPQLEPVGPGTPRHLGQRIQLGMGQ
jgi:hypothetical protein